MNRKVKLFFLALLIVSIAVQGYSIYTYATVKNGWKSGTWLYWVQPLDDYNPDDCWNLTDPDQYILAAIQNPEGFTEPFSLEDSTFWFTAPWHDIVNVTQYDGFSVLQRRPFLYNGTCYDYDIVPTLDIVEYPYPKPVMPEYTLMALAVVWVAVGSVYILKNRKAKSEP